MICGHAGYVVAVVYLCLLVGFAILVMRRLQRDGFWFWVLLLLWCVLPPFVMIGMAAVGHPLFVPRYVTMSVPALTGAVAVVIARLPGRLRAVLATALICASVLGTFRLTWKPTSTDDMRSVVEYMKAHTRPTDTVVVYWPQSAFAFQYYVDRSSSVRHLPVAYPFMQSPENVTVADDRSIDRNLIKKSTRVWFIADTAPLSIGDAPVKRLTTVIQQHLPLVAEKRDFQGVTMILYDRVSGR